jgi:chorismate-pyruvate lyase
MKALRTILSTLPGLLLGLSAAGNAADMQDDNARAWPDTFVARVEALALLQTLNANLLGHDSATQILGEWCRDHRLAEDPRIVVQRVHDRNPPANEEQRHDLRVASADEVRYRHVRLLCGERVLSEADNWYVPSRLTAAMNQQLDTTDAPFGAVVHELHFQRHTLSAKVLWEPLARGWEMGGHDEPAGGTRPSAAHLIVPDRVLEHRAVLALPDGTPISEVVETYTGNVLAFAPPDNLNSR